MDPAARVQPAAIVAHGPFKGDVRPIRQTDTQIVTAQRIDDADRLARLARSLNVFVDLFDMAVAHLDDDLAHAASS